MAPNFQPIRIELEENGVIIVLEGSLPLTLEPGIFKHPFQKTENENSNFEPVPTWLCDWLNSTGLVEFCGNLESSGSFSKIKSWYELAQFVLPDTNPTEPRFQLFARFLIFLTISAQHEEMLKMRSGNSKANELMADLVANVMRSKYQKIEELPEVPKSTIPLFRALFSLREDSNSRIPDFAEIAPPLIDAMRESILANSRLGLPAMLEAPETFNFFKLRAGAQVLVELATICRGLYLPANLRLDLMCQRFQDLTSSVVYKVMDLREMGQGETDNTNVLRFLRTIRKVELPEAFALVLNQLEADVEEFKIVARCLRGLYKKNLRLPKYIRAVEFFVDGCIMYDFQKERKNFNIEEFKNLQI